MVTTTAASIPEPSSGPGGAELPAFLVANSLCGSEIKLLPWRAATLWHGEAGQPYKPGQRGGAASAWY